MSLVEGLEEGASPAPSMGSPLLQERVTYVLVQTISKWGPRLSLVVMLEGKRRAAVQRLPKALLSPPLCPGPSPDSSHPMRCPDTSLGSKQGQSERWGWGPPGR